MKTLKIDKTKCFGCRMCELACAAYRCGEFNYKRARLRVPESFPLPKPPVFCVHCKNPSCVESCPVSCLTQDADGVVILNQEDCTRCMNCQSACRIGAVYEDVKTGYPLICDACGSCTAFCPLEALTLIGGPS